MNQAELIDAIHSRSEGLSKASIKAVLEAQANSVESALLNDGEVTLPGIGKLKTVEKPARTGRNPATGEEMEIPAKTAVKFVAAKVLKDAVA